MKTREFLELAVDYVEASTEAMAELQKRAEEAEAAPAFSEDVLKQTADKLVKADMLSKTAAETLVQSFPENPDQALHSLQRLAEAAISEKSGDQPLRSLGAPVKPIAKKAAQAGGDGEKRVSDEAWEQDWS